MFFFSFVEIDLVRWSEYTSMIRKAWEVTKFITANKYDNDYQDMFWYDNQKIHL